MIYIECEKSNLLSVSSFSKININPSVAYLRSMAYLRSGLMGSHLKPEAFRANSPLEQLQCC